MRASTELFLYDLLFAADTFLRPSWYNVLGPDFDSWAWRKGLTRRLAQLHRQRLVEPHPALATETARIVRLTEAGRLAALGGRDPVARWRRPWDRRWRVVLFDLPRDSVALRSKLHRLLRARHFGFLQGSVWVSPDPIDDWPDALADAAPDPEGFIVIEGRPATGESDAAIVRGAWDFAEINRRYDRHLDPLRLPPRCDAAGGEERLRSWRVREHQLWRHAVCSDPLLPFVLLPSDYRGRTAWTQRCIILRTLARPRS